MLDQLRQIAIFAKTVDHGSFRGAARALDISPSVVSHHIAQLEDQLGTALLYRSTRKLSLTEDGKRLLTEAHAMIGAAEAGLQAVADRSRDPSGMLNVTLPAVLAQSHLVDRIAAFSAAHPKIRLVLDFTDLRREIIGAGIDVAIRMGRLEDSTLKARKLYDVDRILIAALSYAEKHPQPTTPEDLLDWAWLSLSPVRLKPEFRREGYQDVRLSPKPRVDVNDAHALYQLAKAGAGLATVPAFLADADVSTGVVKKILPEWQLDPIDVFAVWPSNAPKESLTGFFLDALSKR